MSHLQHERAPYDPAKRREAYLRTRELKGRRRGSFQESSSGGSNFQNSSGDSQPKISNETKARVEALKKRLEKLATVLQQLVNEAKGRAGVSPEKPNPSSPTKSGTRESSSSDQTAAQKRDAAKRSKDYYEKNKKPTANQETKDLEVKIQAVQAEIKKMRAMLARLKSQTPQPQFKQAGSVGASFESNN